MKNNRTEEESLSVEMKGDDGIYTLTMLDDGNEGLTFIFPNGTVELTFFELMAMNELWNRKQREDLLG